MPSHLLIILAAHLTLDAVEGVRGEQRLGVHGTAAGAVAGAGAGRVHAGAIAGGDAGGSGAVAAAVGAERVLRYQLSSSSAVVSDFCAEQAVVRHAFPVTRCAAAAASLWVGSKTSSTVSTRRRGQLPTHQEPFLARQMT